LALTLSWTLPNQHPSMVDGGGLVLGRGVRAMSITCTSCIIRGQRLCLHLTAGEKWLIDNQLNGDDGTGFNDYREREQALCGDCLRPDCIHLEEARA
jgi:hypothetical protein